MREKEDRFQQRKINSFFGARQAAEEPAAATTEADVDMEARPVCLFGCTQVLCALVPATPFISSVPMVQDRQSPMLYSHNGVIECCLLLLPTPGQQDEQRSASA